MTTNIGFNVHPVARPSVGYSAQDKIEMLAYWEKLQPRTMLFMDWDGMAQEVKRLLPTCNVVHRSHNEGDRAWHLNGISARQFYDRHAKYGNNGVIVQIFNEPDERVFTDRFTAWCVEVCDLFGNTGIPVAIPTFGTGGPHEAVENLSRLAPLWETLKKWQQIHFFSSHEYGTHRGMRFVDPTLAGHDVVPWRVGRHRIVSSHCQKHHEFIPRMLILEWGSDQSFYPLDNMHWQGWRDYWSEEEYAHQCIDANNHEYVPYAYIEGQCIYSWGDTGGWEKFNVFYAETFKRLILDNSHKQNVPQTSPMPIPPPPPTPLPPLPPLPTERNRIASALDALAGDIRKGRYH